MKLEYIDHKKIYIPYLENYPGGVHAEKGLVIEVTEKEKTRMLKTMKNGANDVWRVKRRPPKTQEDKE